MLHLSQKVGFQPKNLTFLSSFLDKYFIQKKNINSNHLFSRIHQKQKDFLNNLVPNSFSYTKY